VIGDTQVNTKGEVVCEEDKEYALIEELLTEKLKVSTIMPPFNQSSLTDVLFS